MKTTSNIPQPECVGHYFEPDGGHARCVRCGLVLPAERYLCPDDRDLLTRAVSRFRCPTCGGWFWRHRTDGWRSRGATGRPIPEPDVTFQVVPA